MSVGYGFNNPYVLNIVPLGGGVQSSASGDNPVASLQEMVNTTTKTINANFIGSYDSGSVQFTSPVLVQINNTIVNLQAKIVELEARIVALGG